MDRKDISIPTVSLESTLIKFVIDTKEVGICDIPNTFLQTKMDPMYRHGDCIIMNIRGVLVDLLCELYNSTMTLLYGKTEDKIKSYSNNSFERNNS